MAVKRVFGTVNGTEVELEYTDGRWIVPVPYIEDMEYIVEIIAEDDAGNRSYVTKMLFVVNNAVLTVNAYPVPYYAVLMVPDGWQYTGDLAADILQDRYCSSGYQGEFDVSVTEHLAASEERRYTCSVLSSIWEKTSMCGFESAP